MTKINFVTSFNETIYNTVGNHLIKSIKTNWEPSIKFTSYYHDFDPKNYSIKDVNLKSLEDVEEYKNYFEVNKEHNGTEIILYLITGILILLDGHIKYMH